ncbi:MAG: hypothetical protein Q8P18_31400 [Pseudomonadota bacterium]|nr:hypothetical protein [Pseudomonadota bacterium]
MATVHARPGPVTEAAAALEAELIAFEQAVEDAGKVRLDTRKNLERAAREVQRAAASYERMQLRIGELGVRLREGTERATGKAITLQEIGHQLQERQQTYVDMMGAHEALMQEALVLRDLAEKGPEALIEVQAGLAGLAERAHEMAAAARAAGFRDLAEDATARFQQLSSLSNKLGGAPS